MENSVIATVNNVPILVLEDKELVPVKPICKALGVAYPAQFQKIKDDDILSSVVVLSVITGADEKQYEMTCLPLEYAFGWLFGIDHRKIKPEAQEAVKKYKMEYYHALYKHFTEYRKFMQHRQRLIDARRNDVKLPRKQFTSAKERLAISETDMDKAIQMTFNEWRDGVEQGVLFEATVAEE